MNTNYINKSILIGEIEKRLKEYQDSGDAYYIPVKRELKEILSFINNLKVKEEPMFKIGDWITDGYLHNKITDVLEDRYIVDTKFVKKSAILFNNESRYHLWTIQDAKDGDVLSDGTTIFIFKNLLSDGSVMSYCDYDTDSGESDAFCPLSVNLMCSKITPSTKEQRDLLFQKMKEADYVWDAEKKELRKINSYCEKHCKGYQETGKCFADSDCKAKREAEQKPVWSEEDKHKLHN